MSSDISLTGKNNVTNQSLANQSYLHCQIHTLILRILVRISFIANYTHRKVIGWEH